MNGLCDGGILDTNGLAAGSHLFVLWHRLPAMNEFIGMIIRAMMALALSLPALIGVELKELYGEWEVDVERTKADLMKLGLSGETLATAVGFLVTDRMIVTITRNEFRSVTTLKEVKDNFTVTNNDGDRVILGLTSAADPYGFRSTSITVTPTGIILRGETTPVGISMKRAASKP